MNRPILTLHNFTVRIGLCVAALCVWQLCCVLPVDAAPLLAGVAKVDITDVDAGPVNDPLYVKALVLQSGDTKVVLLTLDAVAIGEIGYIKNDYLPTVRAELETQFGIQPNHVLANASHCHGVVCKDVAERTIQAVAAAHENLVPVKVGVGTGFEDRIMENRRLKLKSGREADVRHAYSLPPSDEIAAVGPVDPEIGLVRIDREDGSTLAVIYNFACHPIQGVPSGGNTADIIGYASKVIEENLGEDTLALFMQGCGGDINPILYKDVNHPRSAEPLGNMLGLSALRGLRDIKTDENAELKLIPEMLTLPRGDRTDRIAELEAEQRRLLESLGGTSLNFETFLPLVIKYRTADEFPSYYSHRYLHDNALGRDDFQRLDAENRRNMEAYLKNIHTMEELTRVQTNLALLKKHQASLVASGKRTIDVEVTGLRLGEMKMVTFPGELTVQIGLNIKKEAQHELTFVTGYTNGYIYYAPTAEQLRNVGGAQEDSDCILAPEWQEQFESRALSILSRL
ncbi:MAG: hypothetical protein KDA66_01965 [Planctomycetaceae bacterium]|nr:hypothetical protein [Planctomycetaceae bacterium]